MPESQPAPAHLGKYEIIGLLGEGATASVYHARDTVLKREVALKILKPALIADPLAFARFAQEAQTASALFHPYIAAVLDMGEAQGRYYIVLHFVPGQPLDKYIKEHGPLSLEETVRMADQIGEALSFAHKKGFLHRDVKPSNIIRTDEGEFVLTDFGLMRAMMSTGLTSHTGAILGTPSYIAPEIWLDKPASSATDQYALACVVVEALTGRILFTGETPPAIMTAHVLKGLRALDDLTGAIPAGILPALRRALASEPGERYPNIGEFSRELARALHPAVEAQPPQARAVPPEAAAAFVKTAPPTEKPAPTTPGFIKALETGTPRPGPAAVQKASLTAVFPIPKRSILTWGIAGALLVFGCITLVSILNGNWFTAEVATQPPAPTTAPAAIATKPPAPSAVPTEVDTEYPVKTEVLAEAVTEAPTTAPVEDITPEPGLLRVGISYSIDTLDPQKSYGSGDVSYLKLIYEGLVRLNERMEPVPAAADQWEISSDGTMWTFRIREGLTYSDGSLLNAKRFEYAILRLIDPRTESDYRYILDDIVGANALSSADPGALSSAELDELKSKVGVQAFTHTFSPCTDYQQPDCTRLVIYTNKPAPHLPYVLSMWLTFPAREEDIQSGENWWMDPARLIGNGPFVMDDFSQNQESYFSPNLAYWKGAPSYMLVYKHLQGDPKSLFDAYLDDDLVVIPVTSDLLQDIYSSPELSEQLVSLPGSCSYALMFNQQREPFTDRRVREAFVYALDRDAFVKEALNGLGIASPTWIPQGFPGYDASGPRWDYDPAKARQLLAEAGYPSPESLSWIEFTYPDTVTNNTRYVWLKQQYENSLGVSIQLNSVEYSVYLTQSRDPSTAPQASIRAYCPDYPDPKEWLSYFKQSGYFATRIGYANPEFDEVLAEAAVELDPQKRAELYFTAQRLLAQDRPIAELYTTASTFLVKPWVTGYQSGWWTTAFPGENDPLTIRVEKP